MKISIKTPQNVFPSFKGSFRKCPRLHNQMFSNCILLLWPAISFPFPITNKEIEQVVSETKVKPWAHSQNPSKGDMKSTFQGYITETVAFGCSSGSPTVTYRLCRGLAFFSRTPMRE